MFWRKHKKRITELEHDLVMSESRERELKRKLAILCDPATEESEGALIIKYTWRLSQRQDEMILSGIGSFSHIPKYEHIPPPPPKGRVIPPGP